MDSDVDYSKEVLSVATETLRLMNGENKRKFPVAFNIAFGNSQFDADLYHSVRIAVKGWHRSWENEKRAKVALALAGSRAMSNQAHENICPVR